MSKTKNMYADAKTWNPFKGCAFACAYCTPSFQRQSKRQKHICRDCYTYTPHCHADRLAKIPSAVISCPATLTSFCPPDFTRIIERIRRHNGDRDRRRSTCNRSDRCIQAIWRTTRQRDLPHRAGGQTGQEAAKQGLKRARPGHETFQC